MASTSKGLKGIEYMFYAAAVLIWVVAIIAFFDAATLPFKVAVSGNSPPRIGLLGNALACTGIAIGLERQGRRRRALVFAGLAVLWALLYLPLF